MGYISSDEHDLIHGRQQRVASHFRRKAFTLFFAGIVPVLCTFTMFMNIQLRDDLVGFSMLLAMVSASSYLVTSALIYMVKWWKNLPYQYVVYLPYKSVEAARIFCEAHKMKTKVFQVDSLNWMMFEDSYLGMFTFAKEREAAHFKLMWG